MAYLPDETETKPKTIQFSRGGDLVEGETLADVPGLLQLAQKEVPAGRVFRYYVHIIGHLENA